MAERWVSHCGVLIPITKSFVLTLGKFRIFSPRRISGRGQRKISRLLPFAANLHCNTGQSAAIAVMKCCILGLAALYLITLSMWCNTQHLVFTCFTCSEGPKHFFLRYVPRVNLRYYPNGMLQPLHTFPSTFLSWSLSSIQHLQNCHKACTYWLWHVTASWNKQTKNCTTWPHQNSIYVVDLCSFLRLGSLALGLPQGFSW